MSVDGPAAGGGVRDLLLEALARFACEAPGATSAPVGAVCEAAIIDTIAVALGALRHPAAQAARRYARLTPVASGATVWGSGERTTAEIAALVNATPLRGYDYNDLYMSVSGGHPSDLVPGALALAEWRGLSGARVLDAIALGYEIALHLFDTLDLDAHGWDYPVVTALAATAAYGRLIGLAPDAMRQALAITAINHFVSDEVESGDLNARGDLTMWKRFNCGHAARQGVYACLLAESGVEGAVRPFTGRTAFLSKVGLGAADAGRIAARFVPGRPLERATEVTFKRWPVGSRGQSAIQAALAVRPDIGDPWSVREVRIVADPGAYDHLVRRRSAPFEPDSRETADHSLPYIVTAALLDGAIRVESFDPAVVNEPRRRDFLRTRVKALPADGGSRGGMGGYPTRVEVVTADGRIVAADGEPPPGHPARPFAAADFEAKLRDCVAPYFDAAHASRVIAAVRGLADASRVDALMRLVVVADPGAIDGAPAA